MQLPKRPTASIESAATDCEIDQQLDELYGLTDKEIAVVEEATG
jgi:hypothetical protein